MRLQKIPRSLEVGALISYDIQGPYSIAGLSNSGHENQRYVLTFGDYRSKLTYSVTMAKRDEAFEQIKKFITYWNSSIKTRLKHFHTDGGKELIANNVETYLSQHNIKLTHTSAGTPQLNGLVERRQHTVYLSAVAMLHTARLPELLWPYAIVWASIIDQVSPTHISGIFLKRGLPGERGNPKHLEKCC